jgi:hypothetical protein
VIVLGLYLCSVSAAVHAVAWKRAIPVGDPAQYLWPRKTDALVSVQASTSAAVVVAVHEAAQPTPPEPSSNGMPKDWLWGTLIAGLLLTAAFGHTIPFLNLSSQQALYGGRLTRAYLGASNPRRWNGGVSVAELVPGDQIELDAYQPDAKGGPLHLLNVTLNETVSGRSQIEQRDHKGMSMAVGPSGVSVGPADHALWTAGGRGRKLSTLGVAATSAARAVFPAMAEFNVERLDLGGWVSVSGAAFSPGLGAKTSVGLSLLLCLANVRLGFWWDSGITPASRSDGKVLPGRFGRLLTRLLPVQAYLVDELTARFHGPARRRWYLSDGGHFENTGVYELIRRRVPFIILCDCGEDGSYVFEDLANLVRKARTDFGAEISFFRREQLEAVHPDLRPYFGIPQDFRKTPQAGPGSGPHALLAWVYHDDPERRREPGSVLLVLKPSLTGDEPVDVLHYKSSHVKFPQEPTVDQYFDEAQWESYRRLGEHIAQRLFAPYTRGQGWRPADLKRPPYAP